MNDLPVRKTCPLGHTCTKIVGDHIEECMWYVELEGQNPQTGDSFKDKKCAIAWEPILLIENANKSMMISGAVNGLKESVYQSSKHNLLGAVRLAEVIENDQDSKHNELISSRS